MKRLFTAKKAMTLVEVLLAVALLTGVTLTALSALMYVLSNNNAAIKLENDRYNARMALLSISREVHQGLIELPNITPTGELELKFIDEDDIETVVTYNFDGYVLTRTVLHGTSPIPFIPVDLQGFEVRLEDDRWLTITLTGEHGLLITSTLSIARTPTSVLLP
jgi:type II secretory pathway pseudopilin PulG